MSLNVTGALSGNGRRPRSRRELNNLTLDDFTASLDNRPKYNTYTDTNKTQSKPSSPPHTTSASAPTAAVRRATSIRPATSTARLGGGDNTELQTISEGAESQVTDHSGSVVETDVVQPQGRSTVQAPRSGDQLIVTPAAQPSQLQQQSQHNNKNLEKTVQAWMSQNNGATNPQVRLTGVSSFCEAI